MMHKLRRIFGLKEPEKTLEDKLFASVLLPREPRDYWNWLSFK